MNHPLTPERWLRIDSILDTAFELPVDARDAYLDRACAGDPELRSRVDALLAADREAGDFLAAPLIRRRPAPGREPDDPGLAAVAAVGQRIGPYRVLRELGCGGMGAVYLAERVDGQFEQRVALKLIRRGMASDEILRRFLRERQILARLQHPHIARLLDGGLTVDGQPWFAMEHVEGVAITRYADERRLTIDERVRLFVGICDAVRHAHQAGVVHRDLKPSNLLVDAAGEVKLLDFGIAKLLEEGEWEGEGRASTRTGVRLMTPEYAAPEQIRGEPITPATDTYGLGVVLYELLTGHHPYRAGPQDTPAAVERRICHEEPPRPSTRVGHAEAVSRARRTSPARLCRRLAGDLDNILLRALEQEPARRYPSADALSDDLRRHLAGLPVRAKRATILYRAWKFGRRNLAGVAITVSAALALGGASALVLFQSDLSLRNAAAQERSLTRDATASAVSHGLYEEGLRAFHQHDLHGARRLFRAALKEDSALALASHYALSTEWALGLPPDSGLEARLGRLADQLPERERWLVRGRMAWGAADPALLAVAESLTTRFPDDPAGQLLLGQAFRAGGSLWRAMPHLRQAMAMDSLGLSGGAADCTACDALAATISLYASADSLPAAERLALEWVRLQPSSGRAWQTLVQVLESQGKSEEALSAVRVLGPLVPGNPYVPVYPALLDIRAGAFQAADRLLREQVRAGPPDVQTEALWFLIISLRYQGRLREALAVARELRQLRPEMREPRMAEAQVLLEMGRGPAAAALFDSLASQPARRELRRANSEAARSTAWLLTHGAHARAASGDTVAFEALADSIQRLGAETLSAMHQRLHHHVRGLLLTARGSPAAAAREFRRATLWPDAIGSPYSRTSLELGRVLLSLDRPHDAIAVLRPALRGPLEAGAFYTTHTELHEALGRAFEAAGQTDSARVRFGRVLEAWQNADPDFHDRREDVRRLLGALPGQPSLTGAL
jgi:serine/threonine protein kinase/Flp pilus assembly protein TadD